MSPAGPRRSRVSFAHIRERVQSGAGLAEEAGAAVEPDRLQTLGYALVILFTGWHA
jgi:hypothetical protein